MSDTGLMETAYVSREVFEERDEKNQAVIEKNLSDIRSEIKALDTKLGAKMDVLNARMDILDLKIDKVEGNLSTAIEGLLDRFDEMRDYQNKWFTVFGILFAAASIIVPIVVALIQHYVK